MRRSPLGRDGFALGLTVVALLVAGALVGVLFFGALVETRAGRAVGYGVAAALAAEAGWQTALAGWPSLGADTVGRGWRGVPVVGGRGGVGSSVRFRRLNGRLFLVESVGEVRVGGVVTARRTVAVLLDSDSGGRTPRGFAQGPWWFGLSPW